MNELEPKEQTQCPGCLELKVQNKQLQELIDWLENQLMEEKAKNAQFQQSLCAAKKNSRNSSKPPSSDIVKPPGKSKTKGKSRSKTRRTGAQKGHPKHERANFPPEEIDHRIDYRLDHCPVDPSHEMGAEDRVEHTTQQVELLEKPFRVTEHVQHQRWCHGCGCFHSEPLPPEVVAAGLFGPRLTSLVTFLKGKLHCSYTGIQDLLSEAFNLKVSRGYLAKLLQKARRAFEVPYTQLLEALPLQTKLNIDETGHKENAKRLWTWCFRASTFAFFRIANRSAQTLMDVLGTQFKGVLGCDCYGAYRKYARECGVLLQFCMAHLIREIKYLCEYPDPHVQKYGNNMLKALKGLFHTLHRKEKMTVQQFQRKLDQSHDEIWDAAMAPRASPGKFGGSEMHRLIENMVYRFEEHGDGYFRFITSPGVEPTNNIAEQAIRFVVIDRLITQGTRSLRGRETCERLWSVIATCRIQKRSSFEWIDQAITAHFKNLPPPSLLPEPQENQS